VNAREAAALLGGQATTAKRCIVAREHRPPHAASAELSGRTPEFAGVATRLGRWQTPAPTPNPQDAITTMTMMTEPTERPINVTVTKIEPTPISVTLTKIETSPIDVTVTKIGPTDPPQSPAVLDVVNRARQALAQAESATEVLDACQSAREAGCDRSRGFSAKRRRSFLIERPGVLASFPNFPPDAENRSSESGNLGRDLEPNKQSVHVRSPPRPHEQTRLP
jgi:hypothetical protein